MFLTQDEPGGCVVPACWGLIVSLKCGERMSLEQIRAVVEASGEVEFGGRGKYDATGEPAAANDCGTVHSKGSRS